MNYSNEMQSIVAKYAELLFTISDIALLICVDKDILRDDIADNSTNISKLYHSSKLVTIAKLRRQEIEQAELGSNTAIELVSKYIIDQNLDE